MFGFRSLLPIRGGGDARMPPQPLALTRQTVGRAARQPRQAAIMMTLPKSRTPPGSAPQTVRVRDFQVKTLRFQ